VTTCGSDETPHTGLIDQPRVDLTNSCPYDYVAHVVIANVASGYYRDPLARLIDQHRNCARSVSRRRGTS
jgi:hypothetical protein